jgi:hypothetical protein
VNTDSSIGRALDCAPNGCGFRSHSVFWMVWMKYMFSQISGVSASTNTNLNFSVTDCKIKLWFKNFLFIFVLSFLSILFLIVFDDISFCVFNSNRSVLSDAYLNGVKYYYYGKNHFCLEENINFLLNNHQTWKLYLLKYKPLNILDNQIQKNLPWFHYHLWVDSCNLPYRNLLINFQFTHNPNNIIEYNFISRQDLNKISKSQFITNYLYIYDSDLLLKNWKEYNNQKQYIIDYNIKLLQHCNDVLLKYKK